VTGLLRPATLATLSAALACGLLLALLGRLKLALARRQALGGGDTGRLLTALNLALPAMVLLAGVLADVAGTPFVLMAGSAVACVGLTALSLQNGSRGAFAALLVAALGGAGLSAAAVVRMPEAFFGREQPAASMNLGFVFVALGALAGAALADVLRGAFGFRRATGVVALLSLAPGLLAGLASLAGDEAPAGGAGRPDALADVLTNPELWLAALAFAVYAPLEAAVATWAACQLGEEGCGGRKAARALAGFWGALVLGRAAAAYAQHAGAESAAWHAAALVLPALLTAVVLGNLAGTADRAAAGRGRVLLGLLLGPILPTLLGVTFGRLDQAGLRADGTAYGTLFAAGSLGSALLAPVVGRAASRRGAQAALRAPLFLALALTALALTFALAGLADRG
jgi:hypothetical protein